MSNQSAGTSFHMENFKRRSRYAMVFILLILAFGLITVLNINTGNVHISLSDHRYPAEKSHRYKRIQHHLENPSSQDPDGCHSWRCLIPIWFSSPDLF